MSSKQIFAIFSASTNELLWCDEASNTQEALRAHNTQVRYADIELSDPDDFVFVVQVSAEERQEIEALAPGSSLPGLESEIHYFSHSQAMQLIRY
ncbi:hypothetical protein [Comamonas testosteroni]|uniref:hypothetical protein n=1 Tax=Comamonas testosteroni TaxID=285 RepID=UPI0012D2A65C|nr:hypothetical protein [Comamonas testosteroni]